MNIILTVDHDTRIIHEGSVLGVMRTDFVMRNETIDALIDRIPAKVHADTRQISAILLSTGERITYDGSHYESGTASVGIRQLLPERFARLFAQPELLAHSLVAGYASRNAAIPIVAVFCKDRHYAAVIHYQTPQKQPHAQLALRGLPLALAPLVFNQRYAAMLSSY